MPEGENAKIAFVICPLDAPGSETRKRSDQILSYIISPVVKELGYEAVRADGISEPGMITTQIIGKLLEVPLVIADLSYQNANVFYELAIRHAIGKPAILLIEKGQKIPFDISGLRTIELVTESFDLESIERAKDNLREYIKSIQKDPSKVESPVTTAVVFKDLSEGKPEQKLLVQILQKLENIELTLRYGETRTKGVFGNIYIGTQKAPSPIVTMELGGTLNLYFGDVIWSGGIFHLYLSKNGYSSLSTDDKAYGPTFSVAILNNMTHMDTTTYSGYIIGARWIRGMIPKTSIPGGNYYVKAFDGSTAAVAVTDNYFKIVAAFDVVPASGPGKAAIELRGYALPANDYADLSYYNPSTGLWVSIVNLIQADANGQFIYPMLAPDLKKALPAGEQLETHDTITFRMIVKSTGQTETATFQRVS